MTKWYIRSQEFDVHNGLTPPIATCPVPVYYLLDWSSILVSPSSLLSSSAQDEEGNLINYTLFRDEAMYEHDYPFGPTSRSVRMWVLVWNIWLIWKNILVVVMFISYHHKSIDRYAKRIRTSRKLPLGWVTVELPVGELEYFPENILAPTIYQWRRESVNNSPIIVSSFDKITITSKLINHREPWSSISKNGDIVIPI